MTVWRAIRPLDVLYLRGNRLFGAAAGHSEALMPPWPSVFAGAIRSRMLVDAGVDLGRFTDEDASPPAGLGGVLGTPAEPGTFRVAHVALLAPGKDGEPGEPVFPLPADLVVVRESGKAASGCGGDEKRSRDGLEVHRLVPSPWPDAIATSAAPQRALALRLSRPAKPETGWWLDLDGYETWLAGETPSTEQLVAVRDLWKTDLRLGIALDDASRTSATGQLYTSDAVAMARGAGFLVGIEGASDGDVPSDGLLRLGGDGRGAEITAWSGPVPGDPGVRPGEPFVLFLETPGLFPDGWVPPGVDPESLRLEADGLTARLAAAAVPRAQVVSGWDVAAHRPKPAQRAVPAGAVYCFDRVSGDPAASVESLWRLIEARLGGGWDTVWKQRRAEGFNAVRLGRWPGEAGRD